MKRRKFSFSCDQAYPTRTKGEEISGIYALVWGNKAYVGSSENIGARVIAHISNYNKNSRLDKASQALIAEAGGVGNVRLYYEALGTSDKILLREVEATFALELSTVYEIVNHCEPGMNLCDLPELQPRAVRGEHIVTGELLEFYSTIDAKLVGFNQGAVCAAAKGIYHRECSHGGTSIYKKFRWSYI